MTLNRRALVHGVLVPGAMASASVITRAASGHETATPESVEPISVDEAVRRLQTRSVSSPLFPGDIGSLEISAWVDDGDEDLDGTVGAFLVHDTAKGDDDTALIGAYMIHATIRSATDRLAEQTTDGPDEPPLTIFGQPGASVRNEDGTSLVAVVDGFVIVSALGHNPTPDSRAAEGSSFQESDLRALAHLAGLLDHLRQTFLAPT